MATNPACKTFFPMLSPFIDGELSPSERQLIERHLGVCPDCTGRVADLRAESGLVRLGMEMLADEADFTGFAQKVMARITPEKPPLLERIRLSVAEFFTYQRAMVATAGVSAAVVALVAVPLILRGGTPYGYASERMAIQEVNVDASAHVAPVVLNTEDGNAIIWLVNQPDEKKKKKGEEEEEELGTTPPPSLPAHDPAQNAPTGGEL
ncbi:MAG: zf-HC2 domain-containing protein [Myxococcaceae bacterium]